MVMPSCTPLHSVGKAKHYWRRAMGPEDLNTYVKTLRPQRTYASAPVGPQCNAYQRLARKHGTNLEYCGIPDTDRRSQAVGLEPPAVVQQPT